ncbi:NAD(P)/FAD-dependent oxidoreductase [Salinirubellus salinus]|uniref:NAD(P)/FAD-dependent oxidoreductase n=1 Tax=Salinirubellus salinus TaxID=1364945 RepID=A0A9E7UCR2_9EURY|nr:NAD(P)/FAD-dependent oxidoreductase [Salinirubellus salinus]UWM56149.1 NAD(P)/FAD-dependent oxidoreductase [Salinirubellus salinus]
MTEDVVVLGSGYAGTGAILSLQDELNGEADITWVSDVDHHLVLHEAHRCIRDPSIQEKITFPTTQVKAPDTRFVQGRVADVDPAERVVELEDESEISYDYLVVGFGSQTAFFGIEGLEEYSLTLKSLEDALEIHDTVKQAAREASRSEPAQVVVGGAGLSGIQSAGEIARFRDKHRAPIDIHLVEGLDNVFPNNDPVVQAKLTKLLEDAGVNIMTGEFIGEVDEETVYIGDDTELDYDVLLWTGGITGQDAAAETEVEQDERSHRINSASTFQTSDDRIFALGDAALVEQPDDAMAPPTAQAAWQAAEVVGENVARSIRGQPLQEWTHEDKGTLISVGDDAVAHNVVGLKSVVETFGGPAAEMLKKTVAARWINSVAGPVAAAKAFPDM